MTGRLPRIESNGFTAGFVSFLVLFVCKIKLTKHFFLISISLLIDYVGFYKYYCPILPSFTFRVEYGTGLKIQNGRRHKMAEDNI